MVDFYQDMQNTSSELLEEFKQGVIEYTGTTEPVNDWEDPIDSTPITLDAVAKGPAFKYISDLITTSDIEITTAVFSEEPIITGKISIDGVNKEIISIAKIPAAGDPVAWKIFVKG